MKPTLRTNANLTQDQTQQINAILNHDYASLIDRVSVEHSVSMEKAEYLVDQWAAFISLNVLDEKLEVTPPGILDQVWHSAILNTKDYREFCQVRFGRFIDHFKKAMLPGTLGEDDTALKTIHLAQNFFDGLDENLWSADQIQTFVCSNDVKVRAA